MISYRRINGARPKLVRTSANYNPKSSPARAKAKGVADREGVSSE